MSKDYNGFLVAAYRDHRISFEELECFSRVGAGIRATVELEIGKRHQGHVPPNYEDRHGRRYLLSVEEIEFIRTLDKEAHREMFREVFGYYPRNNG